MIPGDFEYRRPSNKREALAMLAAGGENARALSGGHSLIPMMKLRMAAPDTLVDIHALDELRTLEVGRTVKIGAAVTQHELIASQELAEVCPIIRETALLIADPQIRYRGTLGGNVGNGDPGNDMPALMQCLDATYLVENQRGKRKVKARDFYQGAYFTSLKAGEIITEIQFDAPATGHGWSYQKLKRKVGDYATAAAAVVLRMSGDTVKAASVTLTNLASTPLVAQDAARAIEGTKLEPEAIKAAAAAAEAIMEPATDGRGSSEYRTKMGGVMVRRAIQTAASRASGGNGGVFGWLKR